MNVFLFNPAFLYFFIVHDFFYRPTDPPGRLRWKIKHFIGTDSGLTCLSPAHY